MIYYYIIYIFLIGCLFIRVINNSGHAKSTLFSCLCWTYAEWQGQIIYICFSHNTEGKVFHIAYFYVYE